MHDGQLIFVKERFRAERGSGAIRKNPPRSIARVRAATLGLRNRDCRPHAVVIGFTEGHDDVQAVCRAALKQHDELLLVRHRRRLPRRAAKNAGHRAEANHGHAALLQGNTAVKISDRVCLRKHW